MLHVHNLELIQSWNSKSYDSHKVLF